MGLSTLRNQHRSKLTVQTEITSKIVAVLAFETSSLAAELKLESRLVGRADEGFGFGRVKCVPPHRADV